jgi:hypothetical protein
VVNRMSVGPQRPYQLSLTDSIVFEIPRTVSSVSHNGRGS